MASWLDKYEQGGLVLKQKTKDNYGKKPNPNDVKVSSGPNYVGMGNDITGRDYSPAWGGQFQSGGRLPIITNNPKDKRLKAYQDSLNLYNIYNKVYQERKKSGKVTSEYPYENFKIAPVAGKVNNVDAYVSNKKSDAYRKNEIQPISEYSYTDNSQDRYVDGEFYPGSKDATFFSHRFKKPIQSVVYKKSEREPIIVNDPKDPKLKAYQDSLNLYNKNKKLYESGIETKPKGLKYENAIKGENYGDRFYLKEGTPIDVVKKPTQLVKYETPKVEVKVTPKGSKRYIVNDVEVSEEDFLGSGATTGGRKRIIYNTPNRGTQKVLRLDGTPETDPDKIRRALATANKDEMAMGGSLQSIPMAQEGKEVTYVHQPARRYEGLTDVGPGEQYMLKRTVTPYKSKRDIRKYTEAPTDPRQVNFLSNYAGATGEPLNKDFVYPTKVPYEGEKHWNIDRFIIDPQFKNSEKLNTTESTKGEMKKTVLADMYKYFMLQNKGDKDESWKQAKKFVRQEINPRVNGAVYDEYLRKELPIPNIMGITSLVDDSYLQKYENVKSRALSETTQDGYAKLMQENPLSRRKATKVGMDWLMKYKGLSRKEAKETLKKTKESPKYESSNDKPLIDMSSEEAYFKNMRGDNSPNYAMGGGIPGAVGFTYARVAGSAPANGKYTKKTKASAQNGKEMKFYQDGLDFKPNSIAQDGEAIVDPMGQWAHPGEVTIIPATDITMEGVDYPVLGISDTGDQQMMYPGEDYNFDGEYVTEYPMMKTGGWLNKYK